MVQAGGGGGAVMWGMFSWHSLDPLIPTVHCLNIARLSICNMNVQPQNLQKLCEAS